MNLLDWLLVLLVVAYALSGYWQGFVTGAFATDRAAARRPVRHLAGPAGPRRRRPLAVGVPRRAVHRHPVRDHRPGDVPVRRREGARQDHLAAGPGASTPSAVPRSSALAVLLVAWALGVAVRGPGSARSPPRSATRRCSPRSTRRCRPAPARRSRPSTPWSAPASSRATSSRSPASRSRRSARRRGGSSRDPDVVDAEAACSRSTATTRAAGASRAPASSSPTTG